MKSKFLVFSFFCLMIYSVQPVYGESEYPESARERRREGFGSILGKDKDTGGVTIFGKTFGESKDDKKAEGSSKNNTLSSKSSASKSDSNSGSTKKDTNAYLWQAALDSVQSMPILVSDSSGGVLSTDWYEDSEFSDDRYKFNILIRQNETGENALTVTAFKQKFEDNKWKDVKVSSKVARVMKDKILSKAKKLSTQKQK